MTKPGELNSEQLLKEARKLNERLLSTVDELQLFVTALSALNLEQEHSPGGDQ
jgi:hypothetical protein